MTMISQPIVLTPSKSALGEVDWEALYRQLLPRIYNFFRYRVGNDQVAEDLTATTFEKAWRKRHRYRRDLGAFSTWIYTIARNVATDYYRRERPMIPLEAVPDLVQEGSVEQNVERQEDRARLAVLFSQLSEREQELIALKYGAGLTNRAIATLVGLSESNVGTLLHRVVKKLQKKWEGTP